jgi:predicted SprT family Zn-dependent metalloprotease
MLNCKTVGELLYFLGLFESLQGRVNDVLGNRAESLLIQLRQLPLKKSHAVTRLGSYSCRGAEALSIRLQFAQELEQLEQTLLHEVAHFLDHQTRDTRGPYRNPHGRSWRYWLELVGGDGATDSSAAMSSLYRQRLKPVARCKRCGLLLKRLRRLPRKQRWLHRDCGGLLVPLDS